MILATPSHVLPSVTKLCGPFISKLLLGVEKGGAEEGDQSQKRLPFLSKTSLIMTWQTFLSDLF